MKRDNRQRVLGIKSVVPALTYALFHFENAARRHPGKRTCLLCQTPQRLQAAHVEEDARTAELIHHIRNIMRFTWLLTAFTATLSCMVNGATAAEASAAAEAAALQLAKKLYPTCTVSVVVVRVRVPDRLHYRRSRANPPTAKRPGRSFADLPLRPVSSSCASRNSSQNLSAASRTLNVSARMCHSTRSSLAACCRVATWRMHSVSVTPRRLSHITTIFLYLVQRWCTWRNFSEHRTNSFSFHSDEERLVNLVRCSGSGRVSDAKNSSRRGFRSGSLCVHPAHVLGDT